MLFVFQIVVDPFKQRFQTIVVCSRKLSLKFALKKKKWQIILMIVFLKKAALQLWMCLCVCVCVCVCV